MGRKPSKNLNLPSGMRAREQRSGKVYYYYDQGGKPRCEIPLGSDYTEAVRKWGELEHKAPAKISVYVTLKNVADRYIREIFPTKAARTQKNNHAELATLLKFFGHDYPINEIQPMNVEQFMGWRSAAPIAATREKALLSHMFNWARRWGLTNLANPCAGIAGKKAGRNVYVEDAVFEAVYQSACQPVRDAMDLTYLTAQRMSDMLDMSEADIKGDMLMVEQGKTGKRLKMAIEGELEQVIKRIIARKEGFKVRTLQLVCNESGRPMRLQALQTRFQRARARAAANNPSMAQEILDFQMRDLRAKGGTDKLANSGNIVEAQRQLGHSTVAMTEHYIRGRVGDFVKPTR